MGINDSITTGFVVEFKAGWEMAAQQQDSRLQATVTDVGGVTGTSFTHNQLAATEANDVTSRLGDTEWTDQQTSTRIVLMQDKDWSTPIDQFDLPKLLASPQGEYMQNGIAALNRKKDALIYSALLGTALTRDGEGEAYGTAAFDTANQAIVAGGTAMTKAKLLAAKALFRKNEADEYNGEQLYMLFDSNMLEDVLADTTLTSSDFMAVQMLQSGALSGKWLGFNWVPYEALKETAGVRTTVAYTKSSVKFGTGMTRDIDIGPRRDKKNAIQIYARESYGAGRAFENKVVSIDYTV